MFELETLVLFAGKNAGIRSKLMQLIASVASTEQEFEVVIKAAGAGSKKL